MSLKFVPVVAAGLLLLLGGEGAAAPPKWETVFGLARVNGQTKKVDNKRYHLVVLYTNPLVQLLNTDATNVMCLVNGRTERDWNAPAVAPEALPGKEDLRFWLVWMALPDRGEVEILLGPVHFDRPDISPAGMRKQILEGGFVPYRIDVGDIAAIKAASVKELAEKMERRFGRH